MATEELTSLALKWAHYSENIYESSEDDSKIIYKYKDRTDGPPPAMSPDEKFFQDLYMYVIALL